MLYSKLLKHIFETFSSVVNQFDSSLKPTEFQFETFYFEICMNFTLYTIRSFAVCTYLNPDHSGKNTPQQG
jgi:hypothetical protein